MPGTGCMPNTASNIPNWRRNFCQAHGRQAAGGLAENSVDCLRWGESKEGYMATKEVASQACLDILKGGALPGNDRRIGGSFGLGRDEIPLHQRPLDCKTYNGNYIFMACGNSA